MHPVINEDILKIKSAITSWELLRDTTVLITGANGFIPAYMVETIMYLNKTENFNTKIIALVRNKEKANSRFLHLKDLPELEF
ncbi:TPA: SDR family oxidoreductase, partial [Escherichia coli]|nr:SDR family oxidoreductase [Escherichia coli]